MIGGNMAQTLPSVTRTKKMSQLNRDLRERAWDSQMLYKSILHTPSSEKITKELLYHGQIYHTSWHSSGIEKCNSKVLPSASYSCFLSCGGVTLGIPH